jgi:transposase InsO family protein
VIESFNSRLWSEFSDHWYFHYDYIYAAMDVWLFDYNRHRPQGSLRLLTSDEFTGKTLDRRAHLSTLIGESV